MSQLRIPDDVIEHCARHKLCQGCPLVGGLCVAPIVPQSDPRWQEWINAVVGRVRAMKPEAA